MKHQDTNPLHERNEGKEFFMYLINIALADGKIEDSEIKILHRAGKKFGFTDPEIDKMIKTQTESGYQPPYDLESRFHQLYDIISLITSDEEIHDDEMKFAMYFAIASGFDPAKADHLIHFIIRGLEDNLDEEELFVKYKKSL